MARLVTLLSIAAALCLGTGTALAASARPQLRYASGVKLAGGHGNALALVFTSNFKPKGHFSDFIMVVNGQGDHISGRWRLAARRNILFFPVPGPGTYRVILTPGLRNAAGGVLRTRYSGRLTVQ